MQISVQMMVLLVAIMLWFDNDPFYVVKATKIHLIHYIIISFMVVLIQ